MYSYRALKEASGSLLTNETVRELALFVLGVFFIRFIINSGQTESIILLSLGLVFFVFLVTMPLDRCIMLITILAVFNFTYTFFSGASPEDDPSLLKLLKDLAVLVLFINFFLKTAVSGRIKKNNGFAVILIIFFVAYMIFLFFFTIDRTGLPMIFFRYFLAYPLLVLVIARGLNTIDKIKYFFNVFFKVSALISIIAILQALFNLGNNYYGYYANIFGIVIGRATATLGNPNNLAQFLSIGIILYWGLRSRQARESFALKKLGGYALLCFLGVFFTFSRSAFGAMIIVISLGCLLAQKVTKRILKVFFATFFIGTVFFLLYLSFRGGLVALTGDGRIAMYFEFFKEMVASNLEVFFFGFGRMDLINPELFLGFKVASAAHATIADSLYVTVFSQSGVIGLVLFLLILMAALKIGFSLAKTSKDVFIGNAAYAISLLTLFFMIAGFFISNLTLFPSALFFWFFVGILFNLSEIEKNKIKEEAN